MPTMKDRHPALRLALLMLGVSLIVVTPLVALLPGPGGIFTFAAGLALVLRTSLIARRWFARFARRWPWVGALADRGLRRASAKRRRLRDAAR
jgi:hypothetical protein